MRRVSRKSQKNTAQGEKRKGASRDEACLISQPLSRKLKDEENRNKVDQEQTEMDGAHRLSEDEHPHRVHDVRTGKLHVKRILIRGNSVQQELAHIGIFAFVAFEGCGPQPDPYERHQQDDADENNQVNERRNCSG